MANADAGEGPATSQLREYTEVLRDENTPGLLGEAGWGLGNTFYVVLLDNTRVLAVTTVARAVAFLEGSTTHLDGGKYQWVAVKTFGIGEGFNDPTLIKNTVSHWAYADEFQGRPVDQQEGGVHGPFRLDEIDPRAFTPVSATAARGILQTWADQVGNPSAATQAALASDIFGLLEDADSIYRFPSLGEGSTHESGWIVGQTAFHEFIAIDRGGKRLNVIVASDD